MTLSSISSRWQLLTAVNISTARAFEPKGTCFLDKDGDHVAASCQARTLEKFIRRHKAEHEEHHGKNGW
jgi:hypothetical protein